MGSSVIKHTKRIVGISNSNIAAEINNFDFKRGNNIYTIGDSLTSAAIYQPQLITLLGDVWDYVNLGVSGNTTTQMLARITELTNGDGKYCIIWGGINDVVGSISAVDIQNNLQAMYTTAKAAGYTVIAITITPFKNNIGWSAGKQTVLDTVNTWILTTATDTDYELDFYTQAESSVGSDILKAIWDSGDGLHFNSTGYNALGTYINSNVTFTATTTDVELRVGRDIILDQRIDTLSTPSFRGIYLTGNLSMGINTITSGSINSTGTGAFSSVTASGNSTFTGIVYSLNSFQLGALGVDGNIGAGGSALKINGGSNSPDVRIGGASSTNGRFRLVNATGNILIGDIGSVVDDTANILQVFGSQNVQILNLNHSAPAINLQSSTATNSLINFKQSNGTVRGFVDLSISSGEMKFWGGAGGYFPVFGSNNSEAARFNTTQDFGIGLTTSISARLHLIKTTEQLRVGYDASNYYSTTVSSAGAVTFDAVGASAGFTFSDSITIADAKNIILNTTTGTKFGTGTTQKIGFWNATPIVQPTTAVAAATFVANTSGTINDSATWDGYTIGQVVKALRNVGLLA